MLMRSGPAAIWLIRHGESLANVAHANAVANGADHLDVGGLRDADIPLTALGERQSTGFGAWLGGLPEHLRPTAVLSSPYLRARETTRLVLAAAGGRLAALTVDFDERWRDREPGIFEFMLWEGIRTRFPEEAERAHRVGRFQHRPPGGESWADVCLRLRSVFHDVEHQLGGERVLVVSHDACVNLSRTVLEGLDDRAVIALADGPQYANCGLTGYELRPGGYQLVTYNATDYGACLPAAMLGPG